VVDVTISAKTHTSDRARPCISERWTRTGPRTLEYVVTVENPTTFTKPWTVKRNSANKPTNESPLFDNRLS